MKIKFLIGFFFLLVFSESHSQIVNIIDSLKNRMINSSGKERIEIMIAYGRNAVDNSNDIAYNVLMQAVQDSKNNGYTDCLIKAYLNLVYSLSPKAKLDTAYFYLKEAISLSEQHNYIDLLALSYISMGVYYLVVDDYKQSYQAFNTADSISTLNILNQNICYNYSNFSRLLYNLDENETAISYLQKGIDIASKSGLEKENMDLKNSLAYTLIKSKNYEAAEKFLNEVISISKQKNYYSSLAEANQIYGDYQGDIKKDYSKSKEYYYESFRIYSLMGMKTFASTISTRISHIFLLENNFSSALHYAEESLRLREEAATNNLIGSSMINIGNIYNSSGNYKKALLYVTNGLKHNNSIDITANGYKKLYDIKYNLKDYKGALEAMSFLTAYKDSITRRESFKSVSRIELKYELEKSMNEIRSMEYDLQTNKLTFTIIFSAGLLFATIISTIAFLSKRKTNLQLKEINIDNEKIIDEKTAELKKEIIFRTKAEQDLQEALKNEIHLNELKSRFVSMVSHEFRTPLTGIETSADLMKMNFEKENETSKSSKYLKRIYNELNRLTSFLDDILLFSRADSGKLKFTPAETELRTLIINLIEYLKRNNKNFIPPNKISYKGTERKIFCDQNMMETIFTNLFINANKYSPVNTKWNIDIEYSEDYLAINISDNGIGIPEDEIPFLFESFFRGSNTTGIPGTGIGLVTVKQMVDEHKGTITVKNNPGKGVTFSLRFPYI